MLICSHPPKLLDEITTRISAADGAESLGGHALKGQRPEASEATSQPVAR
jgi:hypothetical protein